MKDIKVWPTSWTPAVGGLIVCVCVRARVHACVRVCTWYYASAPLQLCHMIMVMWHEPHYNAFSQ